MDDASRLLASYTPLAFSATSNVLPGAVRRDIGDQADFGGRLGCFFRYTEVLAAVLYSISSSGGKPNVNSRSPLTTLWSN
jgi:hypothetical protein